MSRQNTVLLLLTSALILISCAGEKEADMKGFQSDSVGVAANTPTDGVHPEGKHKKHVNRLINENSPYLLQHAHNPVDWYPWGKEALERALKENKHIFLSIGYSACHWCHVMERESFEDEKIAEILNANFICIKVDREERQDVDDL